MTAVTDTTASGEEGHGLRSWLLHGLPEHTPTAPGPHRTPTEHTHRWWQVMCLTGVDYFSTLGYQPGIAALAAGALSPVATLVLVLLTVGGALPVYRRIAADSPHGAGSIQLLARLLPGWRGKLFVLALLGFAATDFIITITLSAADAATHLIHNPLAPHFLTSQQMLVTLLLITLLGAVFLRGFGEAIGIAVLLVGLYLVLNAVVSVSAMIQVLHHPVLVSDWRHVLVAQHSNPLLMIGAALLVFPKLALGLSGFETGVSVMPLVQGAPDDDPNRPAARIRNTRKLLTTAAAIMSVFLLVTSFATTVLIPEKEFANGGRANGRALAYLAHAELGNAFGTVYDISTALILWFAGASAMAGLLNLVPRYLPKFGMAPDWTRAVRPLVLVFTAISFLVTILFKANVDAQGGAYATGVLVLITSAALAVTLACLHRQQRALTAFFTVVSLVFIYTTIVNIVERPEGVQIAGVFIVSIIVVSVVSRALRSTELRVTSVEADEMALKLIEEASGDTIRFVANEPDARDVAEYAEKERQSRQENHIPLADRLLFIEVTVKDPSEFEGVLHVHGERRYGQRVLRVDGPAVANSIAALLLWVRDITNTVPHVYFNWTERNPVAATLRYLFFGDGEVAPTTREVLRQAEPDPTRRPVVHVSDAIYSSTGNLGASVGHPPVLRP
ncbi:MAG: hypothetical protein JWM67_235 [Mycobacterium sp.]|jgi:hypothetical protein|nr:hypothetical protein [Mycobacterium sp.]